MNNVKKVVRYKVKPSEIHNNVLLIHIVIDCFQFSHLLFIFCHFKMQDDVEHGRARLIFNFSILLKCNF